jgi:hypothetical protein
MQEHHGLSNGFSGFAALNGLSVCHDVKSSARAFLAAV